MSIGLVALGRVGFSWTRDEPVYPPLADGFLTTGPPDESLSLFTVFLPPLEYHLGEARTMSSLFTNVYAQYFEKSLASRVTECAVGVPRLNE